MRALGVLAILFSLLNPVRSETPGGVIPDVVLKEGDVVPVFEGRTQAGSLWKSSDYVGKKYLVIYFYPAAFTSGCTRQACLFRDQKEQLEAADIELIGVSGDHVEGQSLFHRHHSLNFSQLCDTEGRIAGMFGVPVREGDTISRSIDGIEHLLSRGVTASRWTFVIGKDGRVVRRSTAVDPEKDCQNVLETVRRLAATSE